MRQFFNQNQNITLKKETLNEHSFSTYSVVGTFDGYIKPMSRKDAGVNGYQWGKTYLLLCDISVDIDAGDKVSHEGVEWSVQATTLQKRGGSLLSYKESVLILNT